MPSITVMLGKFSNITTVAMNKSSFSSHIKHVLWQRITFMKTDYKLIPDVYCLVFVLKLHAQQDTTLTS